MKKNKIKKEQKTMKTEHRSPDHLEQTRSKNGTEYRSLGLISCLALASFLLVSGPAAAQDCSSSKVCKDIARTLAAEAGGEGLEGMRLVAETIHNRAKAQRKTPYQIISAKNQYYGFTARNGAKLYQQVKAQADQVALDLLAGKVGNKTKGALYFINPKTEKPFRWCKVRTYAHGNHVFYK